VLAIFICMTNWPNSLRVTICLRLAYGTPTLGLCMMLVSFLCFAIMDTSAKWLVMAAIPSLQVAFLRYFVHFLWVILIYFPKNGLAIARSRVPRLQVLRAILLFSATALNFTALKYLPLTITISIFFPGERNLTIMYYLLSVPCAGLLDISL